MLKEIWYNYSDGALDIYWYEKNLFGDIVAVYKHNGTKLISYTYDAWGNFTTTYHNSGASTTATNNPFTYRGYYYDADLGLYYLQTRYYDSNTGRFISPDDESVITATPNALTDKNLYAYCDNNPVMRGDDGGQFWHIFVGAVVGSVISGITKVVSNAIEGKSITDGLGMAMLSGAANGALASSGVGAVGMTFGSAGISLAENVLSQVSENGGFDNFDVKDMIFDTTMGGIFGALGGRGSGTKHLTNLGKQTVSRTVNATTHKGFVAGLKEAGKAFAYYGKNTKKYYLKVLKKTPKDILESFGTDMVTGYVKRSLIGG